MIIEAALLLSSVISAEIPHSGNVEATVLWAHQINGINWCKELAVYAPDHGVVKVDFEGHPVFLAITLDDYPIMWCWPSAIFRDGFESGNLDAWNTPTEDGCIVFSQPEKTT
jgi:hypothetical protein